MQHPLPICYFLGRSWENLLFDKGKMKKLDKLAPCTVLSSERFLRLLGISSDQRTKEMLINPRPEKLIPKKQISSFSTVNCTEKRFRGLDLTHPLGQPEKKPMNRRFPTGRFYCCSCCYYYYIKLYQLSLLLFQYSYFSWPILGGNTPFKGVISG